MRPRPPAAQRPTVPPAALPRPRQHLNTPTVRVPFSRRRRSGSRRRHAVAVPGRPGPTVPGAPLSCARRQRSPPRMPDLADVPRPPGPWPQWTLVVHRSTPANAVGSSSHAAGTSSPHLKPIPGLGSGSEMLTLTPSEIRGSRTDATPSDDPSAPMCDLTSGELRVTGRNAATTSDARIARSGRYSGTRQPWRHRPGPLRGRRFQSDHSVCPGRPTAGNPPGPPGPRPPQVSGASSAVVERKLMNLRNAVGGADRRYGWLSQWAQRPPWSAAASSR